MSRTIRTSRSHTPLPLHRVAASRSLEQRALAKGEPFSLVRRAGEATGRLALALAPHARCIWVAAGTGNNGADGLHAAAWLARAGKRVCVWLPRALLDHPERRTPEARDAWPALEAGGIEIATEAPPLTERDLAIDALLGIGANRAPEGEIARQIARLAGLPCPVLAVDVPSGLAADTGQPLGADAVRAAHTLSLLTLHPGLFTGAGRDYAGEVWFDDLTTRPSDHGVNEADAWLSAPASAASALAPARHADHKGSQGDLAVVGGGAGMSGAALLAARAAHAAGAGRVYVDLLDPEAARVDAQRPELMFRPGWWQGDRAMIAAATVVCGCGGGHAARMPLPTLLRHATRLVLDADGLNLVAGDRMLQALLSARAGQGLDTVLTPHPLEAARLLGQDTSAVQGDRLAAASALAERYRCVVALKGSGTVTAAPGQAPVVNRSGNAALATAGTGDVLAGWLGGTWARSGLDARAATVASVYLHGLAADQSGLATLRAADLVEALAHLRHA